MRPTLEQNGAFQAAFDYLNDELFEGILPQTMLTFSRNHNVVGGYFSPHKWQNDKGEKIHEIALNANVVAEGDLVEAFNIVVHEMVHLWQFEYGNPGRPGYHNKEFAEKCRELGLEPKAPDGSDTGSKLMTTLVEGGRAEDVIANMPENAIFPWISHFLQNPGDSENGGGGGEGQGQGGEGQGQGRGKVKSGARAKYTCPVCGLNAWARHNARLLCGDCSQLMVEAK